MKLLNIPFLNDLIAVRHDLHAHPELAYHETRTSQIVAKALKKYGLEVVEGLAKTGVVGVLRLGDGGRTIGLRADMDALPMAEKNEFVYRSSHHARMHACGHDGHTTLLLGAARYLSEHRTDFAGLNGTVYFIFQPAEEAEAGAKTMIEDGLFDKCPIDAVFGLHNWPGIPVGEMAVMSGPVMAGTCALEISVSGHGCHAAMPNLGVDTMLVAAHLVTALQSVVARNIHPCESAVVSVTQIHGGDAVNIIPDDAVLRGTIRTFKPEVQETVERAIERLCAGVASAFGAQINAKFEHRYPPTINSQLETEYCLRAAKATCGEKHVRRHELPSMGAEDFAYMLREKPGCYVWLGNGAGTGGCSLHNPYYDFSDEAIPVGVSYWVNLVQQYLTP